jgi:hypothetical protein
MSRCGSHSGQSKLAIDDDCAKLERPGKSAATGLGLLLAMSWLVGLGAATVIGIVLATFLGLFPLARY